MFKTSARILVVDDMSTMRKIISKSLKEAGYENLEEAEDGQKAWDKLDHFRSVGQPFDLVISDWNMPELSGLDFLKKCRANDHFYDLPFLMVTAESDKAQVIDAIKAGVSNYIVKPFEPKDLHEKLKLVYKKHFMSSAVSAV